jgi:hypothetical protein
VAQRTHVILVDDIDGGDADETVSFALDGIEYEIDLSEERAQAFRGELEVYVNNGRRVGGRRKSRAAAPAVAAAEPKPAEIRAWAKDNGYDIPDRGRIPADVREAYLAS